MINLIAVLDDYPVSLFLLLNECPLPRCASDPLNSRLWVVAAIELQPVIERLTPFSGRSADVSLLQDSPFGRLISHRKAARMAIEFMLLVTHAPHESGNVSYKRYIMP